MWTGSCNLRVSLTEGAVTYAAVSGIQKTHAISEYTTLQTYANALRPTDQNK